MILNSALIGGVCLAGACYAGYVSPEQLTDKVTEAVEVGQSYVAQASGSRISSPEPSPDCDAHIPASPCAQRCSSGVTMIPSPQRSSPRASWRCPTWPNACRASWAARRLAQSSDTRSAERPHDTGRQHPVQPISVSASPRAQAHERNALRQRTCFACTSGGCVPLVLRLAACPSVAYAQNTALSQTLREGGGQQRTATGPTSRPCCFVRMCPRARVFMIFFNRTLYNVFPRI